MKKSSGRELGGKIRLADSSGLEEYDFRWKQRSYRNDRCFILKCGNWEKRCEGAAGWKTQERNYSEWAALRRRTA